MRDVIFVKYICKIYLLIFRICLFIVKICISNCFLLQFINKYGRDNIIEIFREDERDIITQVGGSENGGSDGREEGGIEEVVFFRCKIGRVSGESVYIGSGYKVFGFILEQEISREEGRYVLCILKFSFDGVRGDYLVVFVVFFRFMGFFLVICGNNDLVIVRVVRVEIFYFLCGLCLERFFLSEEGVVFGIRFYVFVGSGNQIDIIDIG